MSGRTYGHMLEVELAASESELVMLAVFNGMCEKSAIFSQIQVVQPLDQKRPLKTCSGTFARYR